MSRYPNFAPSIILILTSLILVLSDVVEAAYPAGFYNKSGCLYSHIQDGHYLITFPDIEPQNGTLGSFTYDDTETNCTNGVYPGKLVVNFTPQDNYMHTMKLEFLLKAAPHHGYWEVKNITLQINPTGKNFNQTTIEILPIDMYAGLNYSYSCSALTLQSRARKGDPFFKLTLNRFQVQPSAEGYKNVFQSSYDCAVWITLPVLMGLILLLFITFTVMIGVNLILAQGNQNSDIKFSKQGGMLMNQAQLDATKG